MKTCDNSKVIVQLSFISPIMTKLEYNILILPGDGVGPEIAAEAIKILDCVSKASQVDFKSQSALTGGCSIDEHGTPLTSQVLEQARKADAILFGAVGGPKWFVKQPFQIMLTFAGGLEPFDLKPAF